MKYAAYDDVSIYALGETPKAAIRNARNETREPEAEFKTARVSSKFAAWIDENGWDGKSRSFDIVDGYIIDTTMTNADSHITTMKDLRIAIRNAKTILVNANFGVSGVNVEISRKDASRLVLS